MERNPGGDDYINTPRAGLVVGKSELMGDFFVVMNLRGGRFWIRESHAHAETEGERSRYIRGP